VQDLIAVVDDEPDILRLISLHLRKAGYQVVELDSAHRLWSLLTEKKPTLIILDLMLPDMDGLEIFKRLKQNPETTALPVIMVTAKADEVDRILGLELGADDYITKPFSPRELVARVKVVLRRSQNRLLEDQLSPVAGLKIDPRKYTVTLDDEPVVLTTTEFKILLILAQNPGQVFSRQKLLDYLWGQEKIVISRTIDVHVKNLREKLGRHGALIKNLRGVGYKLAL